MARNGRQFKLYSNGIGCLMHRSDDMNELIRRASLFRKLSGHEYKIKNIQGTVVWQCGKGEKDEQT